jgi:soluble lytic murein transglycosylase-like protein
VYARRRAVFALVLAALAAGAWLLLRGEDPPTYSPLNLEDDPWAYEPDREDDFEARAAAGHSHVIYAKSPGGIVATARRVEGYRPQVERAADEAGVDPDLIEGMVLLESAGLPDAMASDDIEGAAGLTQILAQTATGLLGMQVDVERSARLTRRLREARGPREADRIRAQRARVDERFDPAEALAGTGRYLKLALDELGEEDLAVVSYHMGIGNLQAVLDSYGEDDPSYAAVFFDSAPNSNPRTYRRLLGLGDDSKTYLWRVLASSEVMRLYREDREELERLAGLHAGATSAELVLHPPGSDAAGELRPFPNEPARYGLRTASGGQIASEALALAAYIGRGVRTISGVRTPLTVTRAGGFSFEVRRRYRNGAQAEAFQYMLDRLQALNLIAWERRPQVIRVTASSEGAELLQ